MMNQKAGQASETNNAFNHYWEYAKLWRTWIVGTAVAALFLLVNKDVGGKFECRARVAVFFIMAAGLQVLLAWVNKVAAYHGYLWEKSRDDSNGDLSRWVRFWVSVGDQFWIDLLIDFMSLVLVGIAVGFMMKDIFFTATS